MKVWMSFADEDGFRGVAIVDVTPIDIAIAKQVIAEHFPKAQEDAVIPAAATRKAGMLGINPGGQVLSQIVSDDFVPEDMMNRLLQKTELIERGYANRDKES